MDKWVLGRGQKKVTPIIATAIQKHKLHQERFRWRIKWELQIILTKEKKEHHQTKRKIKESTMWKQTDLLWITTLK